MCVGLTMATSWEFQIYSASYTKERERKRQRGRERERELERYAHAKGTRYRENIYA